MYQYGASRFREHFGFEFRGHFITCGIHGKKLKHAGETDMLQSVYCQTIKSIYVRIHKDILPLISIIQGILTFSLNT